MQGLVGDRCRRHHCALTGGCHEIRRFAVCSSFRDGRACGVTEEGGRIVSIKTLSGNVYRGNVFIDATYEGDKRVQAYNFRMCLTDDPANRIPFKKPANYCAKQSERNPKGFGLRCDPPEPCPERQSAARLEGLLREGLSPELEGTRSYNEGFRREDKRGP